MIILQHLRSIKDNIELELIQTACNNTAKDLEGF